MFSHYEETPYIQQERAVEPSTFPFLFIPFHSRTMILNQAYSQPR